ncbi:MAG: HD domain-containing protein, partial [Armatimonadota bacterium]
LEQQLEFLRVVDALKRVDRMTRLIQRSGETSRRENSAEHSWHLALMAMMLVEHANEPVDLARVLQMILVHDIVEIDAGDTFVYDAAAMIGKAEREQQAAERIFGMLPDDQKVEFLALWHEFEARETPEAKYASALDRLAGMLPNAANNGGTWNEHQVTVEQVTRRNESIATGSDVLWDHARQWIHAVHAAGLIDTEADRL